MNRRDRKGKTSPLIHTDDTDQRISSGVECGIPGVEWCKPFGILIDREGEGGTKDRVIR